MLRLAAKGNRTVGFLWRILRDCTTKFRYATDVTMVYPMLEYASTVWDPYKHKDTQLLEKVQQQAARYACNNFRNKTPGTVQLLLNSLKWNNLEQCRLRNQLQMLHQISSGLVNINLTRFCQHADPRTRGAQCLHQECTNHPILFNFFSSTIILNRLEPSFDCHHLNNFTPVIPEPASRQPPQHVANKLPQPHAQLPVNIFNPLFFLKWHPSHNRYPRRLSS